MKLPELFENFMSAVDWNSLDINEKKGLFDALESVEPINMGLFEMAQANGSDENLVLIYHGTDPKTELFLTPKMKTIFQEWLERKYTKGEDGWSYLEWLKQIAKED